MIEMLHILISRIFPRRVLEIRALGRVCDDLLKWSAYRDLLTLFTGGHCCRWQVVIIGPRHVAGHGHMRGGGCTAWSDGLNGEPPGAGLNGSPLPPLAAVSPSTLKLHG